ncbi:MAG: RNase P subunit p30 family protein [Candidatus Thorarchaeota archaeon]
MPTYDLHVRFTQPEHPTNYVKLFEIAHQLGYTGLALESSTPLPKELLAESVQILQRLTISPRSATRLKARAEKLRRQSDLLVVHGRTKPIWLAAAEITVVDIIMLRDFQDFVAVDSQVARAMSSNNKPIELCLHQLLSSKGSNRSRLIRAMRTALEFLVRSKCPLVLTSGANHVCGLRAPRDLAALCYLASVPEEVAKEAILQEPMKLVSTIHARRNQGMRIKSGRRS